MSTQPAKATGRIRAIEVLPIAIRLITIELLGDAAPDRQRLYARVTRILTKAQAVIERRGKQGTLRARFFGIVPSAHAEDLRAWGRRVREQREQAGLSRVQLSAMSGVADSTIRNLETGRHRPTMAIALRLQAVPILGIASPFTRAQLAGVDPIGAAEAGGIQ